MQSAYRISIAAISAVALSLSGCSIVSLPPLPAANLIPSHCVGGAAPNLGTITGQACRVETLQGSLRSEEQWLQYEVAFYDLLFLGAGVTAVVPTLFKTKNAADILGGATLGGGVTGVLSSVGAPAAKRDLTQKTVQRLSCVLGVITQLLVRTAGPNDAAAVNTININIDTIYQNYVTQWNSAGATLNYQAILSDLQNSGKGAAVVAPAAAGAPSPITSADLTQLASDLTKCTTQ